MKRTRATVDLSLYHALFRDVCGWRADLRKSLDLDILRLERLGDDELMTFLMIDLVDTGKIVDKALSTGCIKSEMLPRTLGSVVSASSREFLSGLFDLVFSPANGDIIDDVDPNSIYFLRQVLYLSKKVKETCSDASLEKEIRDFSVIDRSLRRPDLSWSSCCSLGERSPRLSFTDRYQASLPLAEYFDECPRALLRALDDVCRLLFSQLPVFDWRGVHPSHGPGAVADAKSGADKYLFPTWPDKLERVFPHSYFARSREDLDITEPLSFGNQESPARLIAVPKTLKSPRMIASEPTSHQFIQHGLMKWMRANLPHSLKTCVSFLDQQPSRVACLRASASGSHATVDLSSASDRLSCWVVERVFQYNWDFLEALWASRTRTCHIRVRNAEGQSVGEEELLLLKKFAPMGSGVTFPVQSVVYAAAAIASVIYDSGRPLRSISRKLILKVAHQVRVFGDDIILPSNSVPTLVRLLEHLELRINVSKTHWQGHFRESCGMDAYAGVDVTPTYLSAFDPGTFGEELASWVTVGNNAHHAGLWNLASAMLAKIPRDVTKLIPVMPWKSRIACLSNFTFSPQSPQGTKTRWNKNLQRAEVLGLQLSSKRSVVRRDGYQNLLQYFVEAPPPDLNWSSGVLERPRLRLRKRWVDYQK